MTPYLLVGVGGIFGVNARYFVSIWSARRFGMNFPIGTFLINVSGSFLIGFILTLLADRYHSDLDAKLLLTTGFLGGYTTFSTFTFETIALMRGQNWLKATANIVGSVAFGVAGAALGISLAGGVNRVLG